MPDMAALMRIVEGRQGFGLLSLLEALSAQHAALRKHLEERRFDPHALWEDVARWIYESGPFDRLKQSGNIRLPPEGVDDELAWMQDYCSGDLFAAMTPGEQARCERDIMQNRFTAPSYRWMTLQDDHPLPEDTWLVHFTNNADAILRQGFQGGISNAGTLGSTRHISDRAKSRTGGYVFAFLAGSAEAEVHSESEAYGRQAVVFQAGGTRVYHSGDEEFQVVMWGADVDRSTMRMLYVDDESDEWCVLGRDGSCAFTGDFEACVKAACSKRCR